MPNNLDDQQAVELLQEYARTIQEMYQQRPVSLVAAPPLLPFSGDGEMSWSDWKQPKCIEI